MGETCDLAGWIGVYVLKQQEELVGMLVQSAVVLAAVVAQDRLDLHGMLLEEEQRTVIQDLNGSHRRLRGVEPGPDIAAESVQQVWHKLVRDVHLDFPLAVLWIEPLRGLEPARRVSLIFCRRIVSSSLSSR